MHADEWREREAMWSRCAYAGCSDYLSAFIGSGDWVRCSVDMNEYPAASTIMCDPLSMRLLEYNSLASIEGIRATLGIEGALEQVPGDVLSRSGAQKLPASCLSCWFCKRNSWQASDRGPSEWEHRSIQMRNIPSV